MSPGGGRILGFHKRVPRVALGSAKFPGVGPFSGDPWIATGDLSVRTSYMLDLGGDPLDTGSITQVFVPMIGGEGGRFF